MISKGMIVYDFFSGTGSSTKAFEDAGHTVIKFEINTAFDADEHVDVTRLKAKKLIERYGKPDFIWASPPCTCFSVASMGHHWISGGTAPTPRTEAAQKAQDVVKDTLKLIADLKPRYGWVMENPRGMLRKLPVVVGIPRTTVTYCQYGDDRQKPTDLWGVVPGWKPRAMCSPGMNCHTAAPRGSKTGTQGRGNSRDRSMVPYELGREILQSILTHNHKATGKRSR
jgi:hypothetical protein